MLSRSPEISPPPTGEPPTEVSGTPYGQRLGLLAVLLLAAGLRLWRLDQNGFGNPYYSAAVRSMQASWSNFFFGSFDPLGMVTVDKPPVALWIQAASAKLFGFSGPAVLVPQALMGVGCVYLTYHLVRRSFGPTAGLLAAMACALTPISVVVDRDNLPDTALILCLLLAAWALCRAIENGRLATLLLSMVLVGIAFNVKMLAAFLVLPTFYLLYFLRGPQTRWIRTLRLALASIVLAAVSLSWALVVEATPSGQRPYIGGSLNNSALDLALGYNGLARIMGMRGFGPPGAGPPGPQPVPTDTGKDAAADASQPPGPPGGRFRLGGFGGPPGLLRFTSPLLAGQITWLVPLAILGGLTAAWQLRRAPCDTRKACGLLLWAGWLGTHWLVFSFARGIFHEYYSTAMAPALSALFGIGTVALWSESQRGRLGALALPVALLLTAAWQSYVVWQNPGLRWWLLPIVGTAATLSAIALCATGLLSGGRPRRLAFGSAAVGLAALLLCPFVWSMTGVMAKANPVIPTAGPLPGPRSSPGMPRMPGPPPMFEPGQSKKLVALLEANRRTERILMASLDSMSASPIIIETGLPAVALGGFAGMDRVVTRDQFLEMVRGGQLRFVMLGGGPGGGPGPPGSGNGPGGGPGLPPLPGTEPGGNSEIVTWVREHGQAIDPALWQAAAPAEPDDEKDDTKDDKNDQEHGKPAGKKDDEQGNAATFRPPFRKSELFDCRPELGLKEASALR